jgi:hypothetical protein
MLKRIRQNWHSQVRSLSNTARGTLSVAHAQRIMNPTQLFQGRTRLQRSPQGSSVRAGRASLATLGLVIQSLRDNGAMFVLACLRLGKGDTCGLRCSQIGLQMLAAFFGGAVGATWEWKLRRSRRRKTKRRSIRRAEAIHRAPALRVKESCH